MKVDSHLISEWFETSMVAISIVVGVIAGGIAMFTASPQIPAGFYNTIAQILPVFLVALVVEQKLVDRLGLTEEQYAQRAQQSLDIAVGAAIEYEGENYSRARELEESFDSQPEFTWVGRYASEFIYVDDPDQQPDIPAMARRRYRRQRSNEAIFVGSVVLLLIIGEGAALGGMLQNGSARCTPYLSLAVGSTVAVVLALTLSGARELIKSLRR
jgi:hypothetical protein